MSFKCDSRQKGRTGTKKTPKKTNPFFLVMEDLSDGAKSFAQGL